MKNIYFCLKITYKSFVLFRYKPRGSAQMCILYTSVCKTVKSYYKIINDNSEDKKISLMNNVMYILTLSVIRTNEVLQSFCIDD